MRPFLATLLARLAARWIAAGQGCDCSLEVAPAAAARDSDRQSTP
jgi:hypothetical protein